MHLSVLREGRLLLVQRQPPAGDRRVLERTSHQSRRRDWTAVVGEAGRAFVGELAHFRQLAAELPLGDRGKEPDGNHGLIARELQQRAEHGRGVDDGIRVRHREDRAVAAGRGGRGAGRDRLLVLATRRAQVHVRIDERRREHEAVRILHPMRIPLERRSDGCDDAVVDTYVHVRVDTLHGIEDARSCDHERILRRLLLRQRDHATPSGVRAAASTSAGPCVSRS